MILLTVAVAEGVALHHQMEGRRSMLRSCSRTAMCKQGRKKDSYVQIRKKKMYSYVQICPNKEEKKTGMSKKGLLCPKMEKSGKYVGAESQFILFH